MITPGTNFMDQLNKTLYSTFIDPAKYNVSNLIVSGSDKMGEGEHKLFTQLRKQQNKNENNPMEMDQNKSIIYGLDADLIMLSLLHVKYTTHMYLFRDTPEFIQSIDRSLNVDNTYYLDIYKLSMSINNVMNNKNNNNKNNINRIDDYVFICFMLGNDFMPHFPAINIRTGGINKLTNAYVKTIGNTTRTIIKENKIKWNILKLLVRELECNETKYLIIETNKRINKENTYYSTQTTEKKLNKFNNIPSINIEIEKYINPKNIGWEHRYYEKLFDIHETIDDHAHIYTNKICLNYLEGLEWCFNYYIGDCKDWEWEYKYNYPPLLKDLHRYMYSHLININNNTVFFNHNTIVNSTGTDINKLALLCYVLPKNGLHILDEKLQSILLNEIPHNYLEVKMHQIQWAYCKYFWESHIEFPKIELKKIKSIIHTYLNNNS
jgi:5'-3' exonuclease